MSDETYPGATRIANSYSGSLMRVNTVVWHSTEGTSLPSYFNGSEAPTLTAVPDFKAKRLVWYQHFDFDTSARALVNMPGGVETNTLNCAQVEIVGTCDPVTHTKWQAAGFEHLYMPQLPDWAIRDLHAFCLWTSAKHGVPMSGSTVWEAYPHSYGTYNGVRMTAAQWTAFKGHCGHQHVPENLHGDPGLFPLSSILNYKAVPSVPGTSVNLTQDSVNAIVDNIGNARYNDSTLGHTRYAKDFPGAIMEQLVLITGLLKELNTKIDTLNAKVK